jgi:hypothetical protein
MPVVILNAQSRPLFVPGRGSVLVVNNEETHTIYVAPQPGVTANDTPIPPQASVTLDGSITWYGSTVASVGAAQVLVFPGGTDWQNPVGVSIALNALGLATADLQNSQLSVGIPPNVPNVASASAKLIAPGSSPVTFHTFAAAGRLWQVSLSAAVNINASFTGNASFYAQVKTGTGGITLELVELAAGTAPGQDSTHGDLQLNGLPVAAGETLMLDVNNGAAVANTSMRASGLVLYSVP